MNNTQMIPVKVNGQFDIILPKHRAERPEWFTDQGWEKARLASMYREIEPGDMVYYVGAEEGDMAGLVAQWTANILMFEPNDRVIPNIKAIWDANNLERPYFFCGFASSKTTQHAQNYLTDGFPLIANGEVISDHGFKELKDASDIPQIKIDDVVEHGVKAPDVISIDVEGSEYEVLRGAEKTLKQYKPKIYLSLHPEFMHEQYGEWGAELRHWLIDMGYKETLLDYPLHEVHLFYE